MLTPNQIDCSTFRPQAIDHVSIRIEDLPSLLPCCTVDMVLFCRTVCVYQSLPTMTRPILRNPKSMYDCGSSSSIVSLSMNGRILKCSPTSPNISMTSFRFHSTSASSHFISVGCLLMKRSPEKR